MRSPRHCSGGLKTGRSAQHERCCLSKRELWRGPCSAQVPTARSRKPEGPSVLEKKAPTIRQENEVLEARKADAQRGPAPVAATEAVRSELGLAHCAPVRHRRDCGEQQTQRAADFSSGDHKQVSTDASDAAENGDWGCAL